MHILKITIVITKLMILKINYYWNRDYAQNGSWNENR